MKKEDLPLVVIFVLLVVVIAFVAIAHYSIKITGNVVENEGTVVFVCPDGSRVTGESECAETGNLVNNLVVEPSSVSVSVVQGESQRGEFTLLNAYEENITVDCGFSDFEELEPDSICFSYDSAGNFVGKTRNATVARGEKRQFYVGVYTLMDATLKDNAGQEFEFTTLPGTYKREIVIKVWEEGKENKEPEEIRVPLEIVVEEG